MEEWLEFGKLKPTQKRKVIEVFSKWEPYTDWLYRFEKNHVERKHKNPSEYQRKLLMNPCNL